MKYLKRLFLSVIFILTAFAMSAESSYDISEIYSVFKPNPGTKAIGKFDKTIDMEYILTPTKIDTGKYSVDVIKLLNFRML